MHNVTVAHRGFETLRQFANEADTPELEALLESVSRPLESNLLFFHEILRARGVLKQSYPFNSDLVAHRALRRFPTLDSMVLGHMVWCVYAFLICNPKLISIVSVYSRPFPPSPTTDSPVPIYGHIAPPSSPALSSLSTNDSLPDLIPLSDSSSGSMSSKRPSEEMEKGTEEDWSIVDNKRPKLEHLL